MASMERKCENISPFTLRRPALRKTSAEIVNEARQSLRTVSTQRPFTPRDVQRQLFGLNSARATQKNRPPSSFSVHAQNFDAPDSRPGSGSRLSPLEHTSRLAVIHNAEELVKAHPKPPSEPVEGKRGLAGPRARAHLLRAGSLTTLPSLEPTTDAKERLSADEKQCRTEHTEAHTPPKHGPRRTASESKIMPPDIVSPVRPTPPEAVTRKELRDGADTACQMKHADLPLWSDKTVPLLQELESVAAGGAEASVEHLCDLCNGLHAALAARGALGRHCEGRARVLRTLFRLIDLDSARLNLRIATLCLALSVGGNNLLNLCKLIFKISRSESNDVLFHNDAIIGSLLAVLSTEDVCASGEALLYCVGTLKFLSGNNALLRPLLGQNCMGVAQQLIQKLHPLSQPGHVHFTIAGHIHVQLTATLRNLADQPESRPLFLSHGILSELCLVLRHHHNDRDICTNIARIYSKLSSYSECRLALSQAPGCYMLFIELLKQHHHKQDLVVRLLFTLGNLTSKSDRDRELLFGCEGSVDTLLRLYSAYQRRGESPPSHVATPTSPALSPPADPRSAAAGRRESQDVLVKLVRVLANMCIHPAVGAALAGHGPCLQLLMETLELGSVLESEELLVNVAATINNLSFHQGVNSAVRLNQAAISKLMLKLLLSSSMVPVLEATRVYGNLSQSKEVRDFIMHSKVYQFVVTLLGSKSCEVCFSACGVLTNLALDSPSRGMLALEGALTKLVDCLRDFGAGDWQLAGQVCQGLWNLTELGGSERDHPVTLDALERTALLEILTAFSDEEEAQQWNPSANMRDYQKACWEMEFLPIAQKLKNRLQSIN